MNNSVYFLTLWQKIDKIWVYAVPCVVASNQKLVFVPYLKIKLSEAYSSISLKIPVSYQLLLG